MIFTPPPFRTIILSTGGNKIKHLLASVGCSYTTACGCSGQIARSKIREEAWEEATVGCAECQRRLQEYQKWWKKVISHDMKKEKKSGGRDERNNRRDRKGR